jgi:hypothetical protein
MKKALKIGGIILGSIIGLYIILQILFGMSRSFLSGSSSDFGEDFTPSSRNSGFVVPESTGLPSGSISSMFSLGSSSKSVSESSSSDSVQPVGNIDRKIIKTGNLNLKVDRTDDALAKITKIATDNKGEIFSSSFRQNSSKVKSGNVTVKVPVNNFDQAFNDLKKVASLVLNESTSGNDVTEQYADLQSQLKNKQAEEQQYLEILKQAQKIQDILDVTQRLSATRGQIEQLQGRIKLMDSQTDMSTINVSLSEDADITFVDTWRPFQLVKDTFNLLFKDLQKFINFIIVLIIRIIPVLILYVIIFYALYRIGKKIYQKVKNKTGNIIQ